VLLPSRLLLRGIQSYWRLTRALALRAEACVVDADNRVLLVDGAEGGWGLPAGEVRKGETLRAALERTLRDDYGIEVLSPPELFWIYAGGPDAANSQTALSIVRQWRQAAPSQAMAADFFGPDALPAGIGAPTAARIRQALEGRAPTEVC
jgi:ADP-ribose pyrophosphatase YjhB (NUDIX family)